MLKIRRPLGRLIFNMGIAIPGKTVFLIETAPCMYVNFNKTPLTSCDPLTTVCSQPSLWSCSGKPFFSVVLISLVVLRAMCCIFNDHIQLWVVNVCKLPSQTEVIIIATNIRPVLIEHIFQFLLGSQAFSEWDVGNYWSVTRCHLKSPTSCLQDSWA